MNKANLSEKWSKYCNTDKLVDEMMALLSKHDQSNSEHGVCTLLDEYFTNKEPLIKLIATSKNYAGDMRIITKRKFDRVIDADEVYDTLTKLDRGVGLESMLKFQDENGKKMVEYLATGRTHLALDNLPNMEEQAKKRKQMQRFVYSDGSTLESYTQLRNFRTYLDQFRYIKHSKLQNDLSIVHIKDAPVLKAGTKTSRAFNRICHFYGVDKLNPQTVAVMENGQVVEKTIYPYDKFFAIYSDVVSELARNMYFVISLNPLDYLTMSIGVNWHSCHSIAHGGWRGGCLSYMLDNTSMITYVLTDLEDSLHEVPKVYRQMFHYDNGMFMQNRLYPQGNDGAVNLYDKFRNLVIDEFKGILHEDGEWDAEIGPDKCKEHTNSVGAHYVDYYSRKECSIFYPKKHYDAIRNHIMTIGHKGICTKCGKEHTNSSYFYHRRYSECHV